MTGVNSFMSFNEYRAADGWGSSDLRAFRIGPPARVLWERENQRPETDATRRGTAAHAAILTLDLFDATYVRKPDGMTFASKEGKAWRDAQGGKVILSADEYDLVLAIRDAVMQKAPASDALFGAVSTEASVFWTDPDSGEACKGRPDFYDEEYVYDLKVTRDAGPGLAFAAYRNGWVHQLAHYRSGLRAAGVDIKTGRIVAVQPVAPHYVWCVEVRAADLDVMGMENAATLAKMRACREAGEWPGTSDEWSRLDIPQYAIESTVGVLDLSNAEEV